jgi:hypothetical protein
MNRQSLLVLFIMAGLCFIIWSSSACADAGHRYGRHRVFIGLDTDILGRWFDYDHRRTHSSYERRTRREWACEAAHRNDQKGYWVVKREWIPPIYKRVWNPAHYDRRGNWVPARWIRIVERPGHWVETRVWVSGRRSFSNRVSYR